MDVNVGMIFGGLIFGASAVASGIGVGIAAQAAVGAWKKCFQNNKPAPMVMLAFVGNPVSQCFYSFILMGAVMTEAAANPDRMLVHAALSIAATVALCATAIIQGKIAAVSVVAICETRKGFAHNMAAMGVCEAVALFAMVFTMVSL